VSYLRCTVPTMPRARLLILGRHTSRSMRLVAASRRRRADGSIPLAQGERGSSEPFVRHVTQAHPNDLVDPWWMDQALCRDYGEFIYRQWVVDIEDVEPEVVDRSLADGVRLLRRGTLLNARRIQCVLQGDDAIACVQIGRRIFWAGVAARDLERAQHLLEELERSFPEASLNASDERPHVVRRLGVAGREPRLPQARGQPVVRHRGQLRGADTRCPHPLMDPSFSLDGQGRLLVWLGPPGTGKSFALGALAYAWHEHASFHYIADPEAFLGDVNYLFDSSSPVRQATRSGAFAVLEDTASCSARMPAARPARVSPAS
jgi:hypothetical protein